MTSLAVTFDQIYNTKHEFPLVKQTSKSVKRVAGYFFKQSCHYYASGLSTIRSWRLLKEEELLLFGEGIGRFPMLVQTTLYPGTQSGGGGRYDQDTLYIHKKYSKNKKVNKYFFLHQ